MDAGFEASAKAGKEATAARFANGTTIMQTKKNKYNTQEGNKAPPDTQKDISTRGGKRPAKDGLLVYISNSQKSRLWDKHQRPTDGRRAACGRYCTSRE